MQEKGTALITGASTGIGYELAKVFAENGFDLVIVARNKEKLLKIAKEIKQEYGRNVYIISKDLSFVDAAREIFDEVSSVGMEIDILINNAGIGNCGLFHKTDLNKDIEMIGLNITTLTALTKLFAQKMIEKKNGRILNIASTGSYQPGPNIAVYYATKAYVLSFSEAIANELREYGVTVSTLCPGATLTEFAHRAGKKDLKTAMSAKKVAEVGYQGVMKGKRVVVPGFLNKMGVALSRHLPRIILANVIGKAQNKLIQEYPGYQKLTIRSDFESNGMIPIRYTGRGEDISPRLELSDLNENAKSIAIIMDDLDIPFIRTYNHWVIWNMPVQNVIQENIPYGMVVDTLGGAIQGVGYGKHRYRGPKPPLFIRKSHRYQFHVYVLDRVLDISSDSGKKALLENMDGHVIQYGYLTGIFKNSK